MIRREKEKEEMDDERTSLDTIRPSISITMAAMNDSPL